MIPQDAAFPGFHFTVDGTEFFTGLFNINNPDFPNIVYASLLAKEDGVWVEIDKRDPMWDDQQEDITPELMASLIIKDFNITLANYGVCQ